MLAKAIAIAAHFATGDIDEPVGLPSHGDLEGYGTCVQLHYQRNGRGTVVEIVVHACGVTLFRHVKGRAGAPHTVRNTTPHVVAEYVRGISG